MEEAAFHIASTLHVGASNSLAHDASGCYWPRRGVAVCSHHAFQVSTRLILSELLGLFRLLLQFECFLFLCPQSLSCLEDSDFPLLEALLVEGGLDACKVLEHEASWPVIVSFQVERQLLDFERLVQRVLFDAHALLLELLPLLDLSEVEQVQLSLNNPLIGHALVRKVLHNIVLLPFFCNSVCLLLAEAGKVRLPLLLDWVLPREMRERPALLQSVLPFPALDREVILASPCLHRPAAAFLLWLGGCLIELALVELLHQPVYPLMHIEPFLPCLMPEATLSP